MEFVKRIKVLQTLGISYPTLYKMGKNKQIETIKVGQNTLYNLNKYIREHKIVLNQKVKYAYCRVSSNKQKEDLKRQEEMMRKAYPTHMIIKDIGSGLNYKRERLKKIIDMGIKGDRRTSNSI